MLRTIRPALIGLLLCLTPLPGAAQDNPWRVPGAASQPYGQGGYASQPPAPQPPQPPQQKRIEWSGYAALGNSQSDARPLGMDAGTLLNTEAPQLTGRAGSAQQTTQQVGQNQYAAVPQRYDAPPQQPQQRPQPPMMLGDFAPLDRDATQEPALPAYRQQQAAVPAGGWNTQPPVYAQRQPQPQPQPQPMQQTPSWSARSNGYGAYGSSTAQPYPAAPQIQQRPPAPSWNAQQPGGQGGYAYGYGNGYGDPGAGGPSTLNAPYPGYGAYGFPYGTGVPGFYGW